MYTLEIKSSFAKNISKIKTSNPKIYIKIPELLNRLIEWPPFEYYYNTHKLKGKFQDFWSINISGDWRIIYNIHYDNNTIDIYDIGTHSQLY